MICSKDSFTESFSALQLTKLISSQTACHSVHDSAPRFTFTYWWTVRSRTIVHNHSRETQRCFEWYACTKIITQWKCPLCTVKSLNLMVWLPNLNQLLCREWVTQRHFQHSTWPWISHSRTTCWGRESRSCCHWISVNVNHVLSDANHEWISRSRKTWSENHFCEHEWLLLCSKIT